ncbi:hypothetical protein PsorP6_006880 [Peronosclerospora sorghi]|uniref:Uncharacterized protein n=1 Tax=Peronosclerospora sorghi TaxID=230839 RepID=A0ACC0W8C4_9STRA|nr:hypothetical protein PsorP6_006880 [Peronosclerospora sorghi]
MVGTNVFIATAQGVVVTVRSKTVFVLPTSDSTTQKLLRFKVLQDVTGVSEIADDNDEPKEKNQAMQPSAPPNRITNVKLFYPQDSDLLALLLLVDERRLVYYELNLSAETLLLKTSRSVPRSAACMTVGHLKLENGETKYAVILGQKTGDVVAVPFPDLDRDLKALLGHTTSMVTNVAVNYDSSLLLTADRDEKLRVSKFPNTAVIVSYCLGHVASLTKVACSTVTPELVVSTSMDNMLMLWDMITGKLLASNVLLPGIEVSELEPLDEEAEDDDSGRRVAKSLLNVSLTICPKTNTVVVLVNNQYVRFFDITARDLREVTIPPEDMHLLLAGDPSEVCFTDNNILAVSYKKNPFLQLFSISTEGTRKLVLVNAAIDAFKDFRSAAEMIEVVDDEMKTLDILEDGLKKKKARNGEWNKRIS